MTASSRLLVGGDDTIAALATAPGRSATALIRVSGPRAIEIAERITRSAHPPPRSGSLRKIFAEVSEHEPVDRCVLTVFPAPASYTGEDVVEFSVHGGHTVPSVVMGALLRAGAREAMPGEFTRRALLNGKIDLLQAEAVADLIDSRSSGAAAAAMRQLEGGLSRRIEELRQAILEVEALLAYDIDFPEEDDGPIDRAVIVESCRSVIAKLSGLISTAGVGEMLREGALVVIAGAPNTGKSSLFNALVGRRRSLVTEIPGTTRDAIEAVIDAGPWTLRLVDTAGLRETDEIVERMGIEVATDYLAMAEVVLVCGDTDDALANAVSRTMELSRAPLIGVRTKSDLTKSDYLSTSALRGSLAGASRLRSIVDASALTGAGLSEVVAQLGNAVAESAHAPEPGAPLLLRARHLRAVTEARNELDLFLQAVAEDSLPMSVAGTHLRAAVGALESLVGVVSIEDVLDKVFRSFCIGK